jgi:5S rRNA maturation endonuclease (ribonuclease M5)
MKPKKLTIVTEGKTDAELLKRILNGENKGIKFEILSSSGFSSALATARSLLADSINPVVLFIDSDTTNTDEVLEKNKFVESYTGARLHKGKLKTIWAVPEAEILFFTNKDVLQTVLKKEISEDVWEIGKFAPRKALEKLSGKTKPQFLDWLKNAHVRNELRKNELITEILDFAEQAA